MPNKKTSWAIVAGIAVVLVFLGYGIYQKKKSVNLVQYRIEKAVRGTLEKVVLSTGVVLPENRLEIKAPVPGRMEQVLVKEGGYVKKGQLLAWMSSTERAALLDAALAKGSEEYTRWKSMYQPTPIFAPISGTLILVSVESGQTVSTNEAVLVMSNRLTIKAQVDETDIGQIKVGQKARAVLDAYPKQPIEGRVEQIAFDAKTVNSVTTYIVDVLPKSVPEFMRSGMTVNVFFETEKKENVLVLPNDALKAEESGFYVLTKPEESPLRKSIKTGLSDGKRTEIISGLQDGDEVLVATFLESSADPGEGRGGKGGSKNPFSPFGGTRKRPAK